MITFSKGITLNIQRNVLTEDKNYAYVKTSKKLLKAFPIYNQNKSSNIVTDDTSFIYFSEPPRNIRNQVWATKYRAEYVYLYVQLKV